MLQRFGAIVAVLTFLLASGTAVASSDTDDGSGFDERLGAGECSLLGRVYDARRGCARERCVAPAIPFKLSLGTEMCALPGQGRYGYGAAVEYRRCEALHRRWVSETDWCASNPDRRRKLITDAPQCVAPATTYVTHDETEGWYDQCLSPHRVAQLQRLAERHGTSVAREAAARSRTLCAYRPGHTFTRGRCRPGAVPDPTASGTLLVGDSLTWRGTDELGELAPDLTIDGQPARQLRDLAGRLAAFRTDQGDPAGLILELGTNRDRQSTEQSLDADIGSLPSTTVVMFVLPYRAQPAKSLHVTVSSTRVSAWMRTLAGSRPRSCVADWRAVVERHPAVLGDGVHPAPALELFWARWMQRSWDTCLAQAQRAES